MTVLGNDWEPQLLWDGSEVSHFKCEWSQEAIDLGSGIEDLVE